MNYTDLCKISACANSVYHALSTPLPPQFQQERAREPGDEANLQCEVSLLPEVLICTYTCKYIRCQGWYQSHEIIRIVSLFIHIMSLGLQHIIVTMLQ